MRKSRSCAYAKLVANIAAATRIRDVMTPAVTCVTPDVSIESLTELLLERGISGVPVVDLSGRPIGIVSKSDVLRESFIEGETEALDQEFEDGFHLITQAGATVADVMMPIAFTLRATDTLDHAAKLMAAEHVHRIPLTDGDGRVCGIVTTFDLARWVAQS